LAAASLGNISLLRVWSEALTYTRSDTYTMKLPPAVGQYWAILAVLVLLAAGYWLLIVWAERSHIGKLAFLISLVIPANAIRELGSAYTPYLRGGLIRVIGTSGVIIAVIVLVIAGAIVIVKGLQGIYKAALACSLVVAPLIPLTVLQDIWAAVHYHDATMRDKPVAERVGSAGPRRVVWIIFDEMDERIAFDKQPPQVTMPEFQKLRETAIYATAAYSPTSSTLSSIPSLVNGRLVKTIRPVSADNLQITYADSEREVRFGDEANVFSSARAMGLNTGLVGWYHPYCRVLNRDLNSCWWASMPMQFDSVGRTFSDALFNYPRSLFETSLLSPFGQSLAAKEAGRRIQALVHQALQVAADPSLSLVFLHVQSPHAPHPYNRRTRDFTLANSPVKGYLDSLELADFILGQIRGALQEKSLWDSTDVLVSADHSYRSSPAFDGHPRDRRVPFLLKLAGSRQGSPYTGIFNTLLTRELISAILRDQIRTPDQAIAWIAQHGSPFQGL